MSDYLDDIHSLVFKFMYEPQDYVNPHYLLIPPEDFCELTSYGSEYNWKDGTFARLQVVLVPGLEKPKLGRRP